MNKTILISLLAAAAMVTACDEKKADGDAKDGDKAAAKDDKGGAKGGDTGVKECDEYLKKFEECLGNAPAEAKAAQEAAFKTTKDNWAKMAKDANQKAALQGACEQMNKSANWDWCKK